MSTLERERAADPALLRHTRVMALGTIASRATGFLRTVVIAAAVGAGLLANVYNTTNILPNIVYDLLLGGVLTSVVVPLIVRAAARDGDGGTAYSQRLLSLAAVVLGAATVLGVLAAPWLVRLYGLRGPGEQTAVAFARIFLPQLFFYGIGGIVGAILNLRDRFAAPMWTPVLNNLVVIGAGVAFWLLPGPAAGSGRLVTHAQLLVLGWGTTLGIVVQTAALWPSLRRAGFRWRFRLDLAGMGLRHAGRMGLWVLGFVATNQVALAVVARLANSAGRADAAGAGFGVYSYAYQLFQLPYAVVGVSVITATMPGLARHAQAGRLGRVRTDLARALRLTGAVLVPASMLLVVLGPTIGRLVFGHGRSSDAGTVIGVVLAAFSVGLVPFAVFQMHLRAFYARHDARTPTLANLVATAVQVGLSLLLYATLPPGRDQVVGLALAFGLSYLPGVLVTQRLVTRDLPPGRPTWVLRTYVRLAVVSLVAAGAALAVDRGLLALVGPTTWEAVASVVLAGGVATAVVVVGARRLHVPEVAAILRRRPGG